MTCFSPLSAVRLDDGSISFSYKMRARGLPLELPCGQCIGCRLERSRQWAVRCMHEASLYEDNVFITLTYSDDYLPTDGSLRLCDFQNFMKRLRKKFGSGVRFYHCGEYGDLSRRPHYHAILFNLDFPDKKYFTSRNGSPVYTSEILEELWGKGICEIGSVTFESAAYVARYVMKKVTGDGAESHYEVVNPETGEITSLKPEYTTMSRRPGIGAGWFEKYKDDVMKKDRIIMRGIAMKPPKFYDGRFELLDPVGLETVKFNREEEAKKHVDNNTPERLNVRRICKESSIKSLVRPFL